MKGIFLGAVLATVRGAGPSAVTVKVRWSPRAPRALKRWPQVVQDQRAEGGGGGGSSSLLHLPELCTTASPARMYLVTRQKKNNKKKNLELRVYSVKSDLTGHAYIPCP